MATSDLHKSMMQLIRNETSGGSVDGRWQLEKDQTENEETSTTVQERKQLAVTGVGLQATEGNEIMQRYNIDYRERPNCSKTSETLPS